MYTKHFELRKNEGIEYFVCKELEMLGWLTHAFSTRSGGVSSLPKDALNLTFVNHDTKDNVLLNRKRFLRTLDIPNDILYTLKQKHSNKVVVVDAADSTKSNLDSAGDALVSNQAGLALAIQVADCYPVLLADVNKRVIANIHAGWRSTLGGIIEHTLEILQKHFGCKSSDLLAVIGPGIGKCCYEVGSKVVERFGELLPPRETFWQPVSLNSYKLDLLGIIKYQLRDFGLAHEQIIALGLCTSCHVDLFFSYRKEGKNSGRMMAIILKK
jgi:YfiH family protein